MREKLSNATSGTAAVTSRSPELAQELKPEWVQHTVKIERLASSEILGAEDQPVGRAEVEERMSIVLSAGSSIEAAREALVDFVNQLG